MESFDPEENEDVTERHSEFATDQSSDFGQLAAAKRAKLRYGDLIDELGASGKCPLTGLLTKLPAIYLVDSYRTLHYCRCHAVIKKA